MNKDVRQMKVLAKKSLSPTSGTIYVTGLKDEVRIIRDKWGVPHIFANNVEDLFYAEGYTHAQDRLCQMEFTRRLACGTLAEMLGEAALNTDIFMRTLGFRRIGEEAAKTCEKEVDDFTRHANYAYVQGVNEFIKRSIDNPPFEFEVLGWQPSPWTWADSLACASLICWVLGRNWSVELVRAAVMERLGEKRARELFPSFPPETPLVVASQRQSSDIAEYLSMLQKELGGYASSNLSSPACNNWVIDGTKSSTGKPLFAVDEHLPISMPSLYYDIHLMAPGFNVTGDTIAGLLAVFNGHNERIAWSATALHADVQDTYVEKFKPDNPHQYLYQGKWEEAEVCLEQFQVRGKEQPVTKEVLITRHGPIIDSVMLRWTGEIRKLSREGIAVRWTGHNPSYHSLSGQGYLKLNRAGNWEEFRDASRLITVAPTNYLYADVDGNIGYQVISLIPIRAKGQGLVPVPGWTGEHEWVGYIPFDELPSAFNPPAHFLATANNKIVHEDYPYLISHDWAPSYRVRRIVQLLTDKERLSMKDFMNMQGDVYSLWAKELVPFLIRLEGQNRRQRQALGYLRNWDGYMGKDSVAATVFHAWYRKLLENTLREKLGQDLYEQYFRCLGQKHLLALPQLLEYHDSYWFGSGSVSNVANRDKLVLFSLEQAIEELTKTLGTDMSTWRWGRVHTATFRHPFGIAPPLEQVLNAGPVEHGGDETTINVSVFDYTEGFGALEVAINRFIIDMGDLSKSVAMSVPGQSGQPGSKHYRDLVEPWSKVKYHPMLFNREDIEKEAKEVLLLIPGGRKKLARKNKKSG